MPVADAPKMTTSWRCKKRSQVIRCHYYARGLRELFRFYVPEEACVAWWRGDRGRECRVPLQVPA